MRPPKLLQPSPTTLTVRDPILRVSIGDLLATAAPRGLRVPGASITVPAAYCGEPDECEVRAMAAGAVDVSVAAAPDEVWKKVGDFAGLGGLLPRHRVVPDRG